MPTEQFWIYMVTILLAPLFAVQVSELLQKRKEARGRRLWILKTLMATRASRVALDHVQALNMLDIEFHGSDRHSKAVVEAWKVYLDHLNTKATSPDVWISKGDDLFVDLLLAMAKSLGYRFGKSEIRATSYFPVAHGRAEADQERIRSGLAEVLEGKRPIPIVAHAPPQ